MPSASDLWSRCFCSRLGGASHSCPGHEIADRYVGDFNCANETNVYIVAGELADAVPNALCFLQEMLMGKPTPLTLQQLGSAMSRCPVQAFRNTKTD